MKSILEHKSAVCFGDSITWYDGHPYNWGKECGKKAVGFESYLRAEGMQVQNEGISDATICDIYSHILNTRISGFDYIILSSGANDSRYNIPTGILSPLGSSFNESTFIGCLQSCIETFLKRNSKAKIILATPLKGWIYALGGYGYFRKEDGEVEERFAEAFLRVGSFYGLPVCDWFHEIDLTESSRYTIINDPEPEPLLSVNPNTLYSLHPSTEGYRLMADLLLKTMMTA